MKEICTVDANLHLDRNSSFVVSSECICNFYLICLQIDVRKSNRSHFRFTLLYALNLCSLQNRSIQPLNKQFPTPGVECPEP